MRKPILLFKVLLYSIVIIFLSGCRTSYEATTYDYPNPVDTKTKEIILQKKKVYALTSQSVFADNLFDGARLNNFEYERENTFLASIAPENEPINPSPWYAFRLWSESEKIIKIHLQYKNAKHRYNPKVNKGDGNWLPIDTSLFVYDEDGMGITFPIIISADTITVAGQEVINSHDVRAWCETQAKHGDVAFSEIGKSKLGRPLFHLNIQNGPSKDKEVIVILSRQHPPEVTGYLAMQAFIEEIIADNRLANDFRKKYRLLVFPLMNPDGVDLGHWRHNAGGIDMNRDWAYYHQPETKQVTDYIVKTTKMNKSKVILGMDFHSTYYDIYYTRSNPSTLTHFTDYWLDGIAESIDNYLPNDRPAKGITRPTSSGWFYTQFGAESLTYEIADTTSRAFIIEKGSTSAQEMMQLLIYRQ